MKKTISIFILIIICLANISSVFAAYPYYSTNKYHITTGIRGVTIYYYLTPECVNSRLNSDIPFAVSSWVNTTNILWTPLYMKQTTTQSASQVDCYKVYWIPDVNNYVVLGHTAWYRNATTIDPSLGNWYWSTIEINSYNNFQRHKSVQATAAHELGHFLGLNEQNDTSLSIMAQDDYREVQVVSPSKSDLQNLVNLY